jgi:transposase InsO family protein
MEPDKKQQIALFRFGVISPLVYLKASENYQQGKLISEISKKHWDIPVCGRSYIGPSTIRDWLKRYKDSGNRIESLHPQGREDKGRLRSLDSETELALVQLRKEIPDAGLPVLLKFARDRQILPPDFSTSKQTLYRVFKHHGLDEWNPAPVDRRRFEAETVNDLWQSDCMHGPMILDNGKLRKSFLFAFIDDHSRLIPHAEFYLGETLAHFLECLQKALRKRGLPRKLYVDNGPLFRSHQLSYSTAALGIALLHAKPYQPEGKGKIERWFKTVRMQFLPRLSADLGLEELNKRLMDWVDNGYNCTVHSSIKQSPVNRYANHLQLVRPTPKDLEQYFRQRVIRTVDKDRTVALQNKIYEAPVALIGKKVSLIYHPQDLTHIEIAYQDKNYGFLVELNPHLNCRLKRQHQLTTVEPPVELSEEKTEATLMTGQLFERNPDETL